MALAGCVGAGDDNVAPVIAVDAGGDSSSAAGDAAHTEGGGDAASTPPDAAKTDAASDGPADGAPTESGADATLTEAGLDATIQESGSDAGTPILGVSLLPIDFGQTGCGATPVSRSVSIRNGGNGTLAVSATVTGSAFAVSGATASAPASLSLARGMSGTLTVTLNMPSSTTAGTMLSGALNLFTTDPASPRVSITLTGTASGATLAFAPNQTSSAIQYPSTIAFPDTKVQTFANSVPISLVNSGNAPVTFTLGAPSNAAFSLTGTGASITLAAGQTWMGTAGFNPSTSGPASATVNVQATSGNACGSVLTGINLSGKGVTATVSGWQSVVDFGAASCGATTPPGSRTVELQNSGPVPATLHDVVVTGANGFTLGVGNPPQPFTTATIPAATGPSAPGTLDIQIAAPPFPAQADGGVAPGSMPAALTASVQAMIDSTSETMTLQEEPNGASLKFDPPAGFSDFGAPVVLLQQGATKNFAVQNFGTAPATVSLAVTPPGGAPVPAADAGVDAGAIAGAPLPFTLTVGNPLTVPPLASGVAGSTQDAVVFAPVVAGGNAAQLALTVNPSTILCAPLPAPLSMTGQGIGGGIDINPTAVTFGAFCDGQPPGAQSFTVSNQGTLDLNWTLGDITGPGATFYQVAQVSQPAGNANGLLHAGESATIIVSAKAIASAASNTGSVPVPAPTLAALAAQLTITTDVPFDSPHVLTLQEVPLGDRLTVSAGSLAFGQFPVGSTTLAQPLVLTNNANPGSGATSANVTITSSDPAYTVSPSTFSLPAGGGTATAMVTFAPTAPGRHKATLTVATDSADLLCDPQPVPVQLDGTGTAGQPVVSPDTRDFGPINCGSAAAPQAFSVTNPGNQAFTISAVTLGKTSNPPFQLSGLPTLPAAIAIGGSTSFTVTPNPIPQSLASPTDVGDPNVFSDAVTIVTDAATLTVPLKMRATGAIIDDTQPPLRTTWDFGTIGFGSVGTITSAIRNLGDAPATVSLNGLLFQSGSAGVFSLASSPTTVTVNGVTPIVGEFAPTLSNGSWVAQATLAVTTPAAFCEPLPAQWSNPSILLSGSSNSSPPVTATGSLAFPTSNCGGGPPAPQAVTLTNATNTDYPLTAALSVGAHYTVSVAADGGQTGILPGNGGVATVVVTPIAVTSGAGVKSGSAPYADSLSIQVGQTGAGMTPVWSSTFAVSWTLNGAEFSFPAQNNPSTQAFYVADSSGNDTLPIINVGNAAASVVLTPSGTFSVAPGTITISPPGGTSALLTSTAGAPACPMSDTGLTPNGQVTFSYTGPVCQPLSVASVNVYSCMGSLP